MNPTCERCKAKNLDRVTRISWPSYNSKPNGQADLCEKCHRELMLLFSNFMGTAFSGPRDEEIAADIIRACYSTSENGSMGTEVRVRFEGLRKAISASLTMERERERESEKTVRSLLAEILDVIGPASSRQREHHWMDHNFQYWYGKAIEALKR